MGFYDADLPGKEDFQIEFGPDWGERFYNEYRQIGARFTAHEETPRGWEERMGDNYQQAKQFGVDAILEAWWDVCDQHYAGTGRLEKYK